MDLNDGIRRRQRTGDDSPIVRDYESISPISHVEEPSGRGPVLERLLDFLAPVFQEGMPTDAYVHGPPGSGKSAVMTALTAHLSRIVSGSPTVIHTTTRAPSGPVPAFVYVDARVATSPFALYHTLLDAVTDERVPRQGVGTEWMRDRVHESLRADQWRAILVVDHLDEADGLTLETLVDAVAPVESAVSWVGVGRRPPDRLDSELLPPERIEVPPYEKHTLAELLTARVSTGMAERAIDHEQIRRVADWAEGDAHDALSATFGAADQAQTAGFSRVREQDLTAGMNAVPRPSMSLGRVHTLSLNRQLVLRRLIELDQAQSVDAAAQLISQSHSIDLSRGTVKRFLYELAETGIVERVSAKGRSGAGRPPSTLEPRFPTLVFRRLFDLEQP